MFRSKILSKLLVPLLIICIFIYPSVQVSASPVFASIQLEVNHSTYQDYDLSSYDSILQLIEDITNGNIQDKSPEQLEQIN